MALRKNSRGFTLTEVMVGLVLSTAAGITALNFSYFFYRSQIEVISRLQTEENLLRATYAIQRLVSSAINVEKVLVPIPDGFNAPTTTKGRIYANVFTQFTGAGVDNYAAFIRDTSIINTTATFSRFSPAVISFMRPVVGPPQKSGVIFINNRFTNAGFEAPSYSRIYFDKVVEFGFKDVITFDSTVGTPVTSVNLRIVMRHFASSDIATWNNFCPQWNITNGTAGCTNVTTNFKDLGRELRISLTNQVGNETTNSGTGSTTIKDRTLGNIYIFPIGFNR